MAKWLDYSSEYRIVKMGEWPPGVTLIDRCFLLRTVLAHSLEVVFLKWLYKGCLCRSTAESHTIQTALPLPTPFPAQHEHHPGLYHWPLTQFFPLFTYFQLEFFI